MKRFPRVPADGVRAGGLWLSLPRKRDRAGRSRAGGVYHGGQDQPDRSVHIHR